MFSDTKPDHIFSYFLLRTWLIYLSLPTWKIPTYFVDGKVLESTVSLHPIELN